MEETAVIVIFFTMVCTFPLLSQYLRAAFCYLRFLSYTFSTLESALLDFKERLGNETQLFKDWTAQTNCTDGWYGVCCDSGGKVTEMWVYSLLFLAKFLTNLLKIFCFRNLSMANLVGNLPESIGNFSNLKILWVGFSHVIYLWNIYWISNFFFQIFSRKFSQWWNSWYSGESWSTTGSVSLKFSAFAFLWLEKFHIP